MRKELCLETGRERYCNLQQLEVEVAAERFCLVMSRPSDTNWTLFP